jgi:hypothetical protein
LAIAGPAPTSGVNGWQRWDLEDAVADINDVFIELKDLAAHLWRGTSPKPGVMEPGMVTDIRDRVTDLTARAREIAIAVSETRSLVYAVNEDTLGRIESEIKDVRLFLDAVNEQTLARIEGAVAGLRAELTDLRMADRIDDMKASIDSDMKAMGSKLDGLIKAVQSLPQ